MKQKKVRFSFLADSVFKIIIYIATIFVVVLFFSIFLYILIVSIPATKYIFSTIWDPTNNKFGIIPFLIGTITVTFISSMISIILSVCFSLAIFEFCSRRIRYVLFSFVEILACVPSVVFGLIGLVFLGKFIHPSYILAAIVLALMILPIITSFVINGLESVNKNYREAGLALGADRLYVMFFLYIPKIYSSVLSGSLMGISRAIGEAMAISLVIGGSVAMPQFHHFWESFLSRSGSSLTSIIVSNILEAQGTMFKVLFFCGLFIFILSAVINIVILNLLRQKTKRNIYF